jgi:hypothetical protein
MSFAVAPILALVLAVAVSSLLTMIVRRIGRARGAGSDTPLAPTRHVRLVRMADPSN